eukprot:3528267-Prymnesium_polylepis.1
MREAPGGWPHRTTPARPSRTACTHKCAAAWHKCAAAARAQQGHRHAGGTARGRHGTRTRLGWGDGAGSAHVLQARRRPLAVADEVGREGGEVLPVGREHLRRAVARALRAAARRRERRDVAAATRPRADGRRIEINVA